jgi:hypothetical protein
MNSVRHDNLSRSRTAWRTLLHGLLLAGVIELITLISRFGFGLQTTRDTQQLAPWTLGLRIHHGYVGLLGLMLWAMLPTGAWRRWVLMLSIGLIASDLVHHFVVLWPITGSPQFDLRYD